MSIPVIIRILIIALSGFVPATTAANNEPGEIAFFEKSIRPLFAKHCYKCHSADKGEDKGGLTLDTRSGWMDGGDSGPALVPGKVAESLIIEAVEQQQALAMLFQQTGQADLQCFHIGWLLAGCRTPRLRLLRDAP